MFSLNKQRLSSQKGCEICQKFIWSMIKKIACQIKWHGMLRYGITEWKETRYYCDRYLERSILHPWKREPGILIVTFWFSSEDAPALHSLEQDDWICWHTFFDGTALIFFSTVANVLERMAGEKERRQCFLGWYCLLSFFLFLCRLICCW